MTTLKDVMFKSVFVSKKSKNFNSKIRYTHTLELGKSMTSLAFHSDTGVVEYANKELFNYKFKAVYGETLGKLIEYSRSRYALRNRQSLSIL